MRSLLGSGIVAGLSIVFSLSAAGQTRSATASNVLTLPTKPHSAETRLENPRYEYDFIEKGFVWSNKPLNSTATKICKTMKNHDFTETPYAINGDQDWNTCLDTQIRSIGYMRWLKNSGFKPNSRNRKKAQAYLKKNYAMGPWGSYTFAQLREAANSTKHP